MKTEISFASYRLLLQKISMYSGRTWRTPGHFTDCDAGACCQALWVGGWAT
jgi:hypothetical protein